MKRKLLSVAALLLVSVVQAQVGIGTSTPNKSAELTIMSRDKGILIPSIALKSTVDKTTIANGNVESLLVYANTKQGDIQPGFYYWDKTKWVRIVPDADIADEVIKNFTKIVENETVLRQLEQIIQHTTGSVFYDGTKFEYIDEEGDRQLIDIANIVKTNETLTTLVDNGNGTYTYTSEQGTQTIINVPQSVINQFESIVNNEGVLHQLKQIVLNTGGNVYFDGTSFAYNDENGTRQVVDINKIVKDNETLTILSYDATTGLLKYKDEVGNSTSVDVRNAVNSFETVTSVTSDAAAGTIVFKDEKGRSTVLDMKALVKAHETLTTLVDNKNGTYTYISEHGTETIIDVPQSVMEQFESIVSNESVLDQLKQIILKTGGNVYFDGTSFTFNDENGARQVVDINKIVKDNETLTSITSDAAAGTITFKDEKEMSTVLDIKSLVKSHETLTTLVDNKNGTYTYISEHGAETIIDVPQSVMEQFESIVSNEAVLDQLKQIILKTGGNVYFDGTLFTYNDESGARQVVDINTIVKDNETLTILSYDTTTGILKYKDELGASVTVDVKSAVKAFETVTNITSNSAAGTITFKDEKGESTVLDIKSLVKAHETATKLVNHGNGSFTYYNEKAIDANGNPIAAGGTTFTVPKVEKYDLTKTIRFVDGASTSQSWSYKEMNITPGPLPAIYHRSNETYKSVFRAYFGANSNPVTTKYMHIDFTVMANTSSRINGNFGVVPVFSMVDLEIYINGTLVKTLDERIYHFGGSTTGWDSDYGDYSAMIAFPSDLRLNTSGNTIDIRLKPTRNNFFKNATSADSGYFLTGDAGVFNVVLKDNLEINIFEKQ